MSDEIEEKETKTFWIKKPFAGYFEAEVEAENEEEAKEKFDKLCEKITLDFKTDNEVGLGEWEIYDRLVQGNICYVSVYETEIEEMDS